MESMLPYYSAYAGGRTMGAGGELHPRDEPKTGSTILVVEDEVLVRMAIADKLRDAGYSVVEASNPNEALEVLRHNPDVRLVFSDIRMPGSMDGLNLAGLLRSEFSGTKVVLTSGHLAVADSIEHDGFFPKPYNAAEIIQHIAALLD
jgi:CheY-like chemotaxis protein